MNAQVNNPSPTTIKPMQVLVAGKVAGIRRRNDQFYTTIIVPAADSFSSPQTVEIRSKVKIAQQNDEMIRQLCVVGGYARNGSNEEGDRIKFVNITLDAVE